MAFGSPRKFRLVSWHSLIKCTLGQYFISMSFNYIYMFITRSNFMCNGYEDFLNNEKKNKHTLPNAWHPLYQIDVKMKWRLLLHLTCPFKVGEWEVGVSEQTAGWIRTPQVPGSWIGGFLTLFTKLLTDYHYNSIIKLSVRWCVWKVWEGFPCRVWLQTLNWVVMYSSVTFHING